MTAANRRRFIRVLATAEVVEHPMAHSLVARGFAEWADAPAPAEPKKRRGRPRKKPVTAEITVEPMTDLSGAAPKGQDAVDAENEPHSLL